MTLTTTLTYVNVASTASVTLFPTQHGRIKMNEDATTMKHLAVVVGCLVLVAFGLMAAVTIIT